jgi:hypothetical protein
MAVGRTHTHTAVDGPAVCAADTARSASVVVAVVGTRTRARTHTFTHARTHTHSERTPQDGELANKKRLLWCCLHTRAHTRKRKKKEKKKKK